MYDLNQILYYTVEVINRFKGLYLIDPVSEELWMELVTSYRSDKNHPQKKKCKKAI